MLTGNASANRISGGNSSDRINGMGGNDTILGSLGNDELTGGGDSDIFIIRAGDGLDTITDFGGIGIGSVPTAAAIANLDTIEFQGEGLIARNMLLTQQGSDLVISFEGVSQTQVTLRNFSLENLDNLQITTGASVNAGNIRFHGQSRVDDSFDVFDANSIQSHLYNRNTVTFLNDLNNMVWGYDRSNDVINGQGGNDQIVGLSGDDLLRGGQGSDTLTGGIGRDRFVLTAGTGSDRITDFTIGQDWMQLTGMTFQQLSISQGTGTASRDTVIRLRNSNEILATLSGVQASTVTANSFVTN
ncbi:hypothetical protein H6F67_12625 [Microcoleus sp. FACHB-1515]|nr:hypothetical protein [Microcoleus sp. FACHB-1515]